MALAGALAFPAGWARAESAPRYGHKGYAEASPATLADAGLYRDTGRQVKLCAPAARAFVRMTEAAREAGVGIVPISGFRSVAYQKTLFDRAVKRYGSERGAARWVAPPGHSEHATGLALDVGDASRRDTDVEQSFKSTPAARWLATHAARFGFELSFPPDNPQGVQHEPWHWRFVGTDEAQLLFHPGPPKKL